MSSGGWDLDRKAEFAVLVPWLLSEQDDLVRERVLEWLSWLLEDPLVRGTQERPGVFVARVPGTSVVAVWTVNLELRRVILAIVGRD